MFEYLHAYDFLKLVDIVYYVKMLLKYEDISFLMTTTNTNSISNYKIAQKIVSDIHEINDNSKMDLTNKYLDELNQLVMNKMSLRKVSKPRIERLIKDLNKRISYHSTSTLKRGKQYRVALKKGRAVISPKQKYVFIHK